METEDENLKIDMFGTFCFKTFKIYFKTLTYIPIVVQVHFLSMGQHIFIYCKNKLTEGSSEMVNRTIFKTKIMRY
jgi:hypothetical protein